MDKYKLILNRLNPSYWFFDKKFYLETYPDVAKAGVDPWDHYSKLGRREGRLGNRGLWLLMPSYWFFDKKFYLETYPDVAKAGVDPWDHYSKLGRREGRHPNWLIQFIKLTISVMLIMIRPISLNSTEKEKKQFQNFRYVLKNLAKQGRQNILIILIFLYNTFNVLTKNKIIFLFKILKITDISKSHRLKKVLYKSEDFHFEDPKIIGRSTTPKKYCIKTPEQWIATINNAYITDGFVVTTQNNLIMYEPAANPKFNFVAGQYDYLTGIKGSNFALINTVVKKNISTDEAILISGRCSPNYFHVLIEYFGKSFIVESQPDLTNLPIIIDSEMYPQEFEALSIFFPNNPILLFEPNTLLKVKKLHIPSIGTYIPDTLEIPIREGAALFYSSLHFLRTQVLKTYEIPQNTKSNPNGPKVYLTRKKGRVISNNDEVEDTLKKLGYEIMDTGSLSFQEQVELFASASSIVAPNGAALSNLIFAAEGCKVLCLNSPFTVLFPLFASLAKFSKCEFRVLAGEHEEYRMGDEEKYGDDISMEQFHGSYAIDIDTLKRALTL
jgi:hypothetical protein